MLVKYWYRNGSLDAFRRFCIQNRDRPVSVKLTNRSEPVIGALCNYRINSTNEPGLFLLLTDRVFHPAYYGLEGIESMHIGLNETSSPMADSAYPMDIFTSEIMALRHFAQLSSE
jgi:hypothetical protein